MRQTVYMRMARGPRGARVDVNTKGANQYPLETSTGEPLPTVNFAIQIEISEMAFAEASRVLAVVNINHAKTSAEVREIKR